jgi:hypothetical protein
MTPPGDASRRPVRIALVALHIILVKVFVFVRELILATGFARFCYSVDLSVCEDHIHPDRTVDRLLVSRSAF